MRAAAGLGPAAPDDHPVLDDDGADCRIGPGTPEPAVTERERELHEAQIGGLGCFPGLFGFLPELLFQNTEDHFRNVAIRGSSSPVSSSSTASKSLASRKLR